MTTQPSEISMLKTHILNMTSALQILCSQSGARLNRTQFAERLGIHRNTLATRLGQDRTMPRPGKDGKWLLADIIAWESRPVRR